MRTLLLLVCFLFAQTADAEGLLVIASPQVPVDSVSSDELAAIYLSKRTSWSDNLSIVPVNHEAASLAREHFSAAVFERSSREMAVYWNQLRFQGKLPPLVQTSDQAVLNFVRNVPGAIGYVDASLSVTGVKILKRLP